MIKSKNNAYSTNKAGQHCFKRSRLKLAVASTLMAGTSVISAPAVFAQGGAMALEEIVVTARRREESLQDVPIAITAMDEESLRVKNITKFEDLTNHVPSFRVSTSSAGSNAPVLSLRGQRVSEVLMTLDAAVPLYFGDIVMTPVHGTNLAMYDLQNVQVLKGPQGTLFGRNSTGGAVLVTPTSPGDEFGGYAEVKYGSYDLVHVEGAVDLPVSDALKFRLAGRKVDRDGYYSNVADNPLACDNCLGDEDSYGLRASMEVSPTDSFRNLTVISHDENDSTPPVSVPQVYVHAGQLAGLYNPIHNGGLAGLNGLLGALGLGTVPTETAIDDAFARQAARSPFDVEVDYLGEETVESTVFYNTTEFEITDNLRIKNIFGYREVDAFYSRDDDATPLPLFGGITRADQNFTPTALSGQNHEAEQLSEEFQLLGSSFDEKLEWIVGAYWMEMEGSTLHESSALGINPDWPTSSPAAVAAALTPFLGAAQAAGIAQVWSLAQNGLYSQSQNIDTVNTAKALFAEGTFEFNDNWSVTLGGRQSWDTREMTTKQQNYARTACLILDEENNPLPFDQCARTEEEDFSEPTYRLSLNHTTDSGHLLYGSISTGYRSGGYNARGSSNLNLFPFDQETALNYEVGHKGEWQFGDVAVRSNLSLFLQEYDDIQKTQDSAVDNQVITVIVNAASAEISGGEWELTVIPTDNLQLSLNYSYLSATYDEWILPSILPDGSIDLYDNSSADFTYIPRHSISGQLQYTFPIDPEFGEITFTTSAYYQDEMTSDEEYLRWEAPGFLAESGWSAEDAAAAVDSATTDPYTVWNMRLDWRNVCGSAFDLAIYGDNITDEEVQLSGVSVPEVLGYIGRTFGAPRTVGASLRYTF